MHAASRLALTFVLVALLGCGDEQEPSNATAAADRRPNVDGVLPCTEKDEPTNFDAYSVGRKFEGLLLVHQGRRCTQAPRMAAPQVRINSVDYVYGRCEIPPAQKEGGCAPPLQIQSKPRCERGFSNISSREFTIRGIPARYQGGGLALLTGDAMVAIFAPHRGRALRAARALVKAPARPSDPLGEATASGPLPAPKPPAAGCRHRHAQARSPKPRRGVPSREAPNLPTDRSDHAG